MIYKDPLKILLKRRPQKRFEQKAWAVMFKHIEGWTVSAVEFHKDSAVIQMQQQKKVLPEFKYKVAPCKIYITQTYIKAPGF